MPYDFSEKYHIVRYRGNVCRFVFPCGAKESLVDKDILFAGDTETNRAFFMDGKINEEKDR